jgi:hypothetical protein
MLRHIISLILAMTACAILISAKRSAVILTIQPGGELPRRPGDTIEFIFKFPAPSAPVIFKSFDFMGDAYELALVRDKGYTIAKNTVINTAIIVATRIFTVRTPVKDKGAGRSDVIAQVVYEQPGPSGTPVKLVASGGSGDVVPVPK